MGMQLHPTHLANFTLPMLCVRAFCLLMLLFHVPRRASESEDGYPKAMES
jgi:hypothetical protein